VAKGYLVDYEIYLSQEENNKYKSGYVTNHFKEIDGRLFKGAQFFMCGNNYMIDDVTALLLENDVPEENIFYEKFY
jgi:ferredoxin-NADP reductase